MSRFCPPVHLHVLHDVLCSGFTMHLVLLFCSCWVLQQLQSVRQPPTHTHTYKCPVIPACQQAQTPLGLTTARATVTLVPDISLCIPNSPSLSFALALFWTITQLSATNRQAEACRHLRANGYLTYQMTHRNARLCARQLCTHPSACAYRTVHARVPQAPSRQQAGGRNSALSSSAVAQTGINGAINLKI